MSTQTEFVSKAFDQMLESFRKAAESTLQMQQDLFRQWFAGWPAAAAPPAWAERAQKFQKEWSQAVAEFTRKWQENWDRQYQAAMRSLEEAFRLGEAKDAAELRHKTEELWRKSFDTLKEITEAQLRDFRDAMAKWLELTTKWSSAA